MNRKMWSGLKEPTQCAEEREDRQVSAIRSPQALQALIPHVALKEAPHYHRPKGKLTVLRQRTELSKWKKEG